MARLMSSSNESTHRSRLELPATAHAFVGPYPDGACVPSDTFPNAGNRRFGVRRCPAARRLARPNVIGRDLGEAAVASRDAVMVDCRP